MAAAAAEQRLWLRALDCFSDAVCLCDCSQPNWPMLYTNEAWVEQTGTAFGPELAASGFWGMFQVQPQAGDSNGATAAAGPAVEQGIRAAAAARQVFCAAVCRRGDSASGGDGRDAQAGVAGGWLRIEFKSAAGPAPLGSGVPEIVIPSFVDAGMAGAAQQAQQQEAQQAGVAGLVTAAAAPAYYFAVIQRPAATKAGSQGAALQGAAGDPPALAAGLPASFPSGTGSLTPSGILPTSGSIPASGTSAGSGAAPESRKSVGPRRSSMEARLGTSSLRSPCGQPGALLTWTDSGASLPSAASVGEGPGVSQLGRCPCFAAVLVLLERTGWQAIVQWRPCCCLLLMLVRALY